MTDLITGEIDDASFNGILPSNKQSFEARLTNREVSSHPLFTRGTNTSQSSTFMIVCKTACAQAGKTVIVYPLDICMTLRQVMQTQILCRYVSDPTTVLARSTDLASQLVRMVMLVMVRSPNIETFLGKIQDLPGHSPQILGDSIRKMLNWTSLDSQDDTELTISTPSTHIDQLKDASPVPDPRREIFVLEEQVAKTVAQLERRNREFESLDGEHQILSESVARLQETNVR